MILFKIIKSLENLGVLNDGVTVTVKHEIRKHGDGFLGMLLGNFGASMLEKMKRCHESRKGNNDMDHIDKIF